MASCKLLSKGQGDFLEAALSGSNIFLTGKAGTGKSYVVKECIETLKSRGKNVVALAPTGIAANNIQGQTIHSMFSLNPFGVMTFDECRYLKMEKRRLLKKVDTIFIDEVSMLRPDILDGINWTLIKNGCGSLREIQIIFIGDLKQLPSPLDDNTRSVLFGMYKGEEFYHADIFPKLDVKTIELGEVLRQTNEEFIHALNIVREGGKSEYFRQFVRDTGTGVILAPHNTTVTRYNLAGLEAVSGKVYEFEAIVEGNVKADDFNLESTVTVKHGCKVMYLANSKSNNNLVNGTLGTFEVDEDEMFYIKVGGVLYPLEMMTFAKIEYVLDPKEDKLVLQEIGKITQYPIKLAYALTIHKSQGLTFDEITIDLSLPCFSKGQLYTALSRVKSPDGLTIITKGRK